VETEVYIQFSWYRIYASHRSMDRKQLETSGEIGVPLADGAAPTRHRSRPSIACGGGSRSRSGSSLRCGNCHSTGRPGNVPAMSTDPQEPPGPGAEQSLDDQHLVLLRRIEHHLGRIADALEALSPAPTHIVKDLGPVRDVPKPRSG
jgi:hypothetical protein